LAELLPLSGILDGGIRGRRSSRRLDRKNSG